MLAINDSAANHLDLRGAYFDGSLELLRELAVTIDLDTALPRLSAIASKMLPHDALRMACFDQRGQMIVNASTGDVPDMTVSERDELIIDDLRTRNRGAHPPRTGRSGWSAPATVRLSACRPARLSLWSALRSGRSGRWRSIARTCRSLAGSRTTSASLSVAARSPRSRLKRTRIVRSGSTPACSEASTV